MLCARFLIKSQSKNVRHLSAVRFNHQSNDSGQNGWNSALGFIVGGSVAYYLYNKKHSTALMKERLDKQRKSTPDNLADGLPSYDYEDVAKHSTADNRIWVTYKYGVYDITDFIAKHPGGKQILEAAGNAIDPFWDLYQQHNSTEVLEMLEQYRIGNYKDGRESANIDDIWSNQPLRDPRLIIRSERPFNAEPPQELLGDSFITQNNIFYVRHHLPVPEIDMKNYSLAIVSDGKTKIKLSLDDLKNFPKHSVTAALMCAGNRRSNMNEHKPTKGLAWGPSAIGNAVWTGARLKDVLEAAGVKSNEEQFVQFSGMDLDATGKPYGSSIPLSQAMSERSDVILAYEMNGHPISRDHGFPVRAFIPGVVGARCVKWLNAITIGNEESRSHWQRFDYKSFNPSVDPTSDDYVKSTSIQALPVISAVLTPKNGDTVKVIDGFVQVSGYAWSGGGQKIIRVDASADCGKTWMDVGITEQDNAPAGRHWSWTFWTVKIPVKKNQKEVEIWVKALDSNHNTQPDSVANIWNARGVLNNSMDRIKLKLK